MSRNGSGTYTLPAGNPVSSGTLIDAAWANSTLSDIATALTDSLSRSGSGGMTAPLRFTDGSVSAPGIAWTNETSSGFYRAGASDFRIALNGVDVATVTSTGLTVVSGKTLAAQGNATVAGTLGVTGVTTLTGFVGVGTSTIGTGSKVEVRGTNTITDARGILAINSTNAAGANLGGSISFGGETGQATTPYVFGSVAGRYAGSGYSGYLQFNVTTSGGVVTERARIDTAGVLAVPAGMTTATQTAGTNNTTVATTAFVQEAMRALHPVGSVYINASNSTNPATLLGFGTWVAFGAGRVPVGFDASNAMFDAAEETGGSYDAAVVSHTHTASTGTESVGHTHTFTTNSSGSHTHSGAWVNGGSSYTPYNWEGAPFIQSANVDAAGAHTHTGTTDGVSANHTHAVTVNSTGSSGTNANVQPYITVYMWKRTA